MVLSSLSCSPGCHYQLSFVIICHLFLCVSLDRLPCMQLYSDASGMTYKPEPHAAAVVSQGPSRPPSLQPRPEGKLTNYGTGTEHTLSHP